MIVLLVVAAVVVFRLSPAGHLLSFENLKREQTALLSWVQQHSVLSVAAFISLYILVTAASLPGAAVLTMAGGSVFGVVPTTIYVNIGATTGAVLAFLAARYLLGDWLQGRYGAQMIPFNREMDRNGARYLLGLRLLPVFPFFLINLLAGLTRVPVGTFAWTTAVGIIPGTAVYAFAGQELAGIGSVAEILSLRVALAFGLLALAAVMPALLDRAKEFRRSSK
jgi:uncharacterized membrane protein YdjX (TVP38/TMEM64 family)